MRQDVDECYLGYGDGVGEGGASLRRRRLSWGLKAEETIRKGDQQLQSPWGRNRQDYLQNLRASVVGPPGTASDVMGRVWIRFSVMVDPTEGFRGREYDLICMFERP